MPLWIGPGSVSARPAVHRETSPASRAASCDASHTCYHTRPTRAIQKHTAFAPRCGPKPDRTAKGAKCAKEGRNRTGRSTRDTTGRKHRDSGFSRAACRRASGRPGRNGQDRGPGAAGPGTKPQIPQIALPVPSSEISAICGQPSGSNRQDRQGRQGGTELDRTIHEEHEGPPRRTRGTFHEWARIRTNAGNGQLPVPSREICGRSSGLNRQKRQGRPRRLSSGPRSPTPAPPRPFLLVASVPPLPPCESPITLA